jgi:PAS domain S-box-containing protein
MSPALLAVAGFDGYLRRFNPAFDVFGYSPEELLSRPWIDFAHPDDRERMLQAAASLEGGGDVVELENRVVCRDGSVRWVEWSTRVGPEEGLFYAAGRDVTESHRVAEEQAALRRVATLVARETAPDELFAAVGREVGEVLGVDATHLGRYEGEGTVVSVAQWGGYRGVEIGARYPLEGDSVSARVLRTGRAARMNDYEHAPGVIAATMREIGIRFSIGVPISVEGRLWGVMIATSKEAPFRAETESRLRDFTDLLATAISNASARDKVRALADEQAALHRVATLVARSVPPAEVFEAVAREAGQLLGVDAMHMGRYDDGAAFSVAGWSGAGDTLPVGTRVPVDGVNVASLVLETGRPARLDGYSAATGTPSDRLRHSMDVFSSVAVPVVVDGRMWGLMIASSKESQPLPADTEERLLAFTELAATAISNSEARTEAGRLTAEQAALRRVATLVARERPPEEVFAAVAEEVGRLLPVEGTAMLRGEDEGHSIVASWGRGDDPSVGSTISCPIVVDGRLWGTMVARQGAGESLPREAEARIGKFTELAATAISNVQARSELAASRARIVAAADDERRRVVRDLHDGAQQRLVHTVVTLKLAQEALRGDAEDASALLEEALSNAQQATSELRELSRGILPGVLTRGGLRAAVEALASRMPIPVEATVCDDRMAPAVEATAYFVIAEALTNVAKHAYATQATVLARVEGGALRICVSDDGIGGARREGSGLVGLADRLAALDGHLRVESPKDGGTVVAAEITLIADEAG